MADVNEPVLEIKDDFYRDGIKKVAIVIAILFVAICFLVALSLYLYLTLPPPVGFKVDNEWRVQGSVSVDKPYLREPDMLQWVSDVFPRLFTLDFLHYQDRVDSISKYFTPNGYKVFLNQLNIYANKDNLKTNKLFVTAVPAGAPYILNQNLIAGRYSWWVRMPITISYASWNRSYTQGLSFDILVVRVSTLDNLTGIAIDNVILSENTGKAA